MENEFKFEPDLVNEALNYSKIVNDYLTRVRNYYNDAKNVAGLVNVKGTEFLFFNNWLDSFDKISNFENDILYSKNVLFSAMLSFEGIRETLVTWIEEGKITFEEFKELAELYSKSHNGENLLIEKYDGKILIAPDGRIEYDRMDGVHVQESWCQLQYLDTVLGHLRKYEGDKIVEGQYIKDLEVWTRDDGVKMLGPYVMVATDVKGRKAAYGIDDDMTVTADGMYDYGDIVETTLGKGIVMDVCSQAKAYRRNNGDNYTNLEVYTDWGEREFRSIVYDENYEPKNFANDPQHKYKNGKIDLYSVYQSYMPSVEQKDFNEFPMDSTGRTPPGATVKPEDSTGYYPSDGVVNYGYSRGQ